MTDTQATPTPTSVYRYYDDIGVLLYVGITRRGVARNREHNASKPWWQFVRSQEVDHYASRREALHKERTLIQQFRPPFNRQHNIDARAARNAYESFRAAADAPGRTPELVRSETAGRNRIDMEVLPGKGIVYLKAVGSVAASIRTAPVSSIPVAHGRLVSVWHEGQSLMATVKVRQRLTVTGATLMYRFTSQKPLILTIKRIDLAVEDDALDRWRGADVHPFGGA